MKTIRVDVSIEDKNNEFDGLPAKEAAEKLQEDMGVGAEGIKIHAWSVINEDGTIFVDNHTPL